MYIGKIGTMAFVYILQSEKNNRYYIGSTNDIRRRLAEHLSGKTASLKHLLPVKLVFSQNVTSLGDARRIEIKLKKYKSRVILEKIIKDGTILGL